MVYSNSIMGLLDIFGKKKDNSKVNLEEEIDLKNIYMGYPSDLANLKRNKDTVSWQNVKREEPILFYQFSSKVKEFSTDPIPKWYRNVFEESDTYCEFVTNEYQYGAHPFLKKAECEPITRFIKTKDFKIGKNELYARFRAMIDNGLNVAAAATVVPTNGDDDAEDVGDKKKEQDKKIGSLAASEANGTRTRLDKLNPDKTSNTARRKMTDTESIKRWIDNGESVLLRGPSGIGKTERIKRLYPNLLYMKLTNNMFPEKVVGNFNFQTGEHIPPDFAKHAIMNLATKEEKARVSKNIQEIFNLAETIKERSKNVKEKFVILLDELLNVKPAVQSLVYTLVLNKMVEIGKGLKLPDNVVVVATGNQKKYSSVAEDLAEPLEKRFDHILDMEPKVGEWISEYAVPNSLHPAVIAYIFSNYQQNGKSEEISKIKYLYEEPEVGEKSLDKFGSKGRTNDPRGWDSLSKSLYNFEADLKSGHLKGIDVADELTKTIGTKLRGEWATDFFDFYNSQLISPEEVVNNKYTKKDLPQNVNDRFRVVGALLSASEKQVGACRKFIKQHCDAEYLAVYDVYWAGNDECRMKTISEDDLGV